MFGINDAKYQGDRLPGQAEPPQGAQLAASALRRSPFTFSARLYSTDAARPGEEEEGEGEDVREGKEEGPGVRGDDTGAEDNSSGGDSDSLREDLLRASMKHVVSPTALW